MKLLLTILFALCLALTVKSQPALPGAVPPMLLPIATPYSGAWTLATTDAISGLAFLGGINSTNATNIFNSLVVGQTNAYMPTLNGIATNVSFYSNLFFGPFPTLLVDTNIVGIHAAGVPQARGNYFQTLIGTWTNTSGNGSAIVFMNPTYFLQTNNVSLYSTPSLLGNSVWVNVIGSTAVPTNSGFGYRFSFAGLNPTNFNIAGVVGILPMISLDTTKVLTNNETAPVVFDAANAATNTFGGKLTILGNSIQEGTGITTPSLAAHSEGTFSVASGVAAHAEGNASTASGASAHAEGQMTIASGLDSHAAGSFSNATNDNSYVWSDGTTFGSLTNQTFSVYARKGISLQGGVISGNGGGLTNLPSSGFTGDLVWVDQVNGNNNTALRGRADRPSLTISNAVKIALAGDTVMVLPGSYNDNNLRKPGVNFFGYPGANIIYKHTTTNDPGWGIFDDRAGTGWGASTNTIVWNGTLAIQGFTNFFGIYGNTWFDQGLTEISLGTLGVIVQTNPASILYAKIQTISTPFLGAGSSASAGIYFKNGGTLQNKSILDIGQITCPYTNYAGVNYIQAGVETGMVAVVTSQTSGIYWEDGDLDLKCPLIDEGTYAIYCAQAVTNLVQNFDFEGDQVFGKIYTVAANQNYVGWLHFNQIQPSSIFPGGAEQDTDDNSVITNIIYNAYSTYTAGNAIDIYGSGKWYFEDIGKILVPSAQNGLETVKQNATDQNPEIWYTGEKIECTTNATWIKHVFGNLHMDVQHFSTTSPSSGGGGGWIISTNSSGFGITTPFANIRSQDVLGSTTAGLLNMNGGNLILDSMIISNTIGTPPITIGVSGLTLKNTTLFASNSVVTITSAVPTTVSVYGGYLSSLPSVNTTLTGSPNITNASYGTFIGNGAGLTNIPSGAIQVLPRIPTAVTLTGSVFTFSNSTPNYLECYFSGSVAYSVSKNGAAVFGSLASDGYLILQPTNKIAITYTVAPTLFTNAF